jgi:hypothetical protein
MKELQKIDQDKTELVAIKPVKAEQKFVARISPEPGQSVFELNTTNGAIRKITDSDYEQVNVKFPFNGEVVSRTNKKLVIGERCLYVAALNVRNAKKKFSRMVRFLLQ